MVSLKNIQNNRRKFITAMVIIMISATLLNYGLFSFLAGVFKPDIEDVYGAVQANIIFTIIVIGVAISIMFALIPKEQVNSLLMDLENGGAVKMTPEQELSNMIDELDEKK